ncbi:MAG: hypothetical protein COA33_000375 [Fluviicola sp.]|nr:hypothetical protein [Fluviicola sp.]
MSDNILYTILLSFAYLILFASAELFYHKLKFKAEVTRKYVHIVTGLLAMLFPILLDNHWFVLILCSSFLIILLLSLKFQLLPSINAVERITNGSILYPIIVYSLFLLYQEFDQYMFYYIPILILALCDPIAALVGKKWPAGKYTFFGHTKTLSGSFGFLIAALITSLALTMGVEKINFADAILISIVISIITALSEAFTHKGFDNLAIPASAVAVLLLYTHYFA